MKKIFALSIALLLCGCGEDGAKRAIEANGFKDVQLTGMVWWGCGEHDNPLWNSKFSAVAINGKPVTGVVCGGMLKGWTVRMD